MKCSKKRCEDVDIEELSNENPCKPCIFCSTYLGGCYGPGWKFGGVKKKVWNGPKKVWKRWYRGIFTWKHMQTLYSCVALIQVVVMVQIGNLEVCKKRCKMVQKGVKTLI